MEFIYADALKKKFAVYGHFYNLEINGTAFSCRSMLEITSKSEGLQLQATPNAVVVMMNPGSCRPVEPDYTPRLHTASEMTSPTWEKILVPARPDNAQYQIMRLMLLKEWKHVRILNLSDLRNGNSRDFSLNFATAKSLDPSSLHSITHTGRLQELKRSCLGVPLVIAAWGTNEVLRQMAESFLSEIRVRGISLNRPWYRYPSPYRKDQKIEWLKNAFSELGS